MDKEIQNIAVQIANRRHSYIDEIKRNMPNISYNTAAQTTIDYEIATLCQLVNNLSKRIEELEKEK